MLWFLIVVGLAFIAHTAPFPFAIDGVASRHVMWQAPARPATPTVYLTFDDGPNPTATPQLLDVLDREQARATFFLVGRNVTPETAPLVRRMFAEGHGVGVHSASRGLVLESPSGVASWLEGAADHIERSTGRRPCRAFRPHAGWRSATMVAGVARAGYQLVGWGWNAWDWNWFRRPTADAVVTRIAARATDGLIVVIHDGDEQDQRADRRYAVEAAARLVPLLRARGFRLGTICDVLEGTP